MAWSVPGASASAPSAPAPPAPDKVTGGGWSVPDNITHAVSPSSPKLMALDATASKNTTHGFSAPNLFKAARDVGVSTARFIPRAVGELEASATGKTLTPNRAGRYVLGTEPLQPIQRQGINAAASHPGGFHVKGTPITLTPTETGLAEAAGKGLVDITALHGGIKSGFKATTKLSAAIERAKASPLAPRSALDTHVDAAETAANQKPVTYTSKTKGDIPVETMSPTHAKNALASVQKTANADPELVKALTQRASLKPPKIPVEPNKVNPATKTFASKLTVLRKIGTPSSNKLADAMRNADLTTGKLRTNFTNMAPTFRSLKGGNLQTAWQVAEGKLKTDNPVIQKAADEARSTMDAVEKARVASGREAGHIENYMPREYDFAKIKKDSAQYNNALNSMVKSGAATDLEDAAKKFSYLSKPGNLQKTSFSHFDLQRGIDMPGYKMNRDVFDRYVSGASQDIANSTHFGANNEITNKLLAGVIKENGDAGLAKEAVQNYLHAPNANSKVLTATRGLFGLARLGKAAIAHAGQTSNVLLSSRTSDFISAWAHRFGGEGSDFVDQSGVNHPSVIHGYTDQYTGLTGKMSKATAPRLKNMMQVNRGVASLAGRRYAGFLAAKGDTASLKELSDLGVTGDIGKTLTKDQQFEAARGMADKTMFNPSRATTPIKAETSLGKTIGQYRVAYVYKQTGLLYNQVLKQAAHGNLKPLAKFMAISSPVGYGIVALKGEISGRKQGPGGIAIDTAGQLAGLPGDILVQMGRYAKNDILKTTAGVAAPLAGEAVNVGEVVQNAIKDKYGQPNPKPAEQYAAGLLPVFGPRIGKALNPPSATNKTLNQNPDVQKTLKGINYSISSAPKAVRGQTLSGQTYKDYVDQSNALFIQKAKKATADPSFTALSKTDQKRTLEKALSDSRTATLDKLGVKKIKVNRPKVKSY